MSEYERRGTTVVDLYDVYGSEFAENYKRFRGQFKGEFEKQKSVDITVSEYIELLKARAISKLASMVGDAGEDFADHFSVAMQRLSGQPGFYFPVLVSPVDVRIELDDD